MIEAIILGTALYGGICVVLLMGWFRWSRTPKRVNPSPDLSLISFAIGNASVLLAISSMLYARVIGGFPFYDPRLLKIIGLGLLVSLLGVVLGLLGRGRSSSLRNYAPLLSGWMFFLWFFWAAGE